MPGRNQRPSLQHTLDREVFQVVSKLLEDSNVSPTPHDLYDAINRSNSSLKRRPKKLLLDCLDRVCSVLQDEQSDAGASDPGEPVPIEEPNSMNRAITKSWQNSPGTTSSTNGTAALLQNGKSSKKRPRVTTEDKQGTRSPPAGPLLEDLGGVGDVKKKLSDLLVLPLLYPQVYIEDNLPIPSGVLLHGPPGCGKTMICRAFAAKLGVNLFEILGPSIVSSMSGDSEKQIREIFDQARTHAPSIIFIDEIDVIAPKRESSNSQMDKRIVAQLLVSMDSLGLQNPENDGKPVIVIAATNRPDALDPALRRGGRFDTEISMGIPNTSVRALILRAQTRHINLDPDVDFERLAKMTPGFVGADLKDLVLKAGSWTMDQFRKSITRDAMIGIGEGEADDQEVTCLVNCVKALAATPPVGQANRMITMAAFLAVLPSVQPSSKREGFASVPDTTWEDIGALKDVRKALQTSIVRAIQEPERYARFGIENHMGVLLWGPPGCGKTILAKATAAESQANFISVSGPDILNKYVGESERAVRQVFMRARSSVPCIIFFDELDALVPRRNDSLSEASSRVVNTLLAELDGLSDRSGIYVIGATNRPDLIEAAMLRPGRFGKLLYVGLPGPVERHEILSALIRDKPIDPYVPEIGATETCDGFSGADLRAMLTEAGQIAIDRDSDGIECCDVRQAAKVIRASAGDVSEYETMREKLKTRN
ncbi:Ribosome biogenesis ATPase rix7 [Elasticomyces elasticus]|nr:Ribosome biogenesis ATPase rix7 [Elasticomyces elasticus]